MSRAHIRGRLAEVALGGALNTVGVATKSGDVEIRLQDFFFRELLLQTNRQLHFIELALEACFNGCLVGSVALFFGGQEL